MLQKTLLLTILLFFSIICKATAADVLQHLDIDLALQNIKVQEALHPDIRLFFAGENPPLVEKNYGVSRTSKRTNSFMKDKIESCEWALASALVALQDNAIRYGGNAVIDITSNINNRKNPSSTQFDCLVGTMLVHVALEAKIVKLAQ